MLKNKNLAIILVNPQLPENIGMSARAMMNCGFYDLRIVNPRDGWPNKLAIKSSVHAKKIISKTKIFDSFENSVSDLNFLVATTARRRYARKDHFFSFLEIKKIISDTHKVGIVFGPENSGLSNEVISKCDCIFSLPLKSKQTSLNLSHSVLIICYELSKFYHNIQRSSNIFIDIATKAEFNGLMNHLHQDLISSGFLNPPEKRKIMFENIQNMFLRANFTSQEIRTFRGILKKLKNPIFRQK